MTGKGTRLPFLVGWLIAGGLVVGGWAFAGEPARTGPLVCDLTFTISNGGDRDARVYFERSWVRTDVESIPPLFRKWRPMSSMQNYRIPPGATIRAPFADTGECSSGRTWKITYRTGSSEEVKQFTTIGDRLIEWGDIRNW